jgi:glycerophosphoryl diester phosphodiesterase
LQGTIDVRIDPIFGLPTPILFAHRGGVREAPEGTQFAFQRALDEAKAEVLELDLQCTRDGKLVVWHGPELDNVFIEGVCPRPAHRSADENDIREYEWSQLDGRAWVAGPPPHPLDLSEINRSDDRRLLSLERYLKLFPGIPTNIELKGSIKPEHVECLIALLDLDQGETQRKLLLVSAVPSLIREIRKQTKGRSEKQYATGFSAPEVLSARLRALVRLPQKDATNRALQSVHASGLSPQRLVTGVQKSGGAVHLFLTAFRPFHAIDEQEGEPTVEQLRPVLMRGVDGIMTDRPVQVRRVMESLGIRSK